MITLNRDDLIKKKGNVEIPFLKFDLNDSFDYSTIIDIILELFLKHNNKEVDHDE